MKKELKGCSIVIATIVIILGAGIFLCVRWCNNVTEDITKKYSDIKEAYDELNALYPFTEPADGLIRAERYKLWLQTRDGMSQSITAYDTIMKDFNIKSIGKLKDHTFQTLQQFHDLIKESGISPEEYTWISCNIIGALNSGDMRANPRMQDVVEAFDALKYGNEKNVQARSNDLDGFGVPVTSAQIVRIAFLIRQNEAVFIRSIKVFRLDVMIIGLSQELPNVKEEMEDETAVTPK